MIKIEHWANEIKLLYNNYYLKTSKAVETSREEPEITN